MARHKLHRRIPNRRLVALFVVLAIIASIVPWSVSATETQAPLALPSDASGKVRVILQGADAREAARVSEGRGGRVIRDLRIGGGVAVELPASQVAAVARATGARRVVRDVPVVSQSRDDDKRSPNKLASAYPWAVMSPQLWQGEKAITGKKIGVAIIDSGIAPLADFGNRVVAAASFGDAGDGKVDYYGHGTAVAGVIGGKGDKYIGIAPEVDLISLKVGNDAGVAYVSDVVAAIVWAVDNMQPLNIRVLGLALTSTVAESYKTSLLDFAVEYAWVRGIVVVVAAGNCDADAGERCDLLYPPANDPYVITVGATDDHGTKQTSDDSLASFSVFGNTSDGHSKPDVAAPGRHLNTTLSSPNNALVQAKPGRVVDSRYIRLSGTSLSAGVVSGVVAQLLQAHPELRPDQVKWLLSRTAQAVGPGKGTPGTGAGYPQAQRAVAYGGNVGLANRGIVPNNLLALLAARSLGLTWNGVSWDGVSWDGVSWDGVSWDGVSWDGVSWDGVSWDGVSWDGIMWDGVSWDGVSWDGVSWDGVSWDAMPLD